jgi:uncharacterized membrane protein YkvA (DUF1232 family)
MPAKRDKHSRVVAQTVREWVYEYEIGSPVWPLAWGAIAEEGYVITPLDFDPSSKDIPEQTMKNRITIRI